MRTKVGIGMCLVLLACGLSIAGCASAPEPADESAAPAPDTGGSPEVDAVSFALTSSAYDDGAAMPARFARQAADGGENVSPPIEWSEPPQGTASLALVMVDRHPVASEWIHWLVVDLPADATGLAEGASGATMPTGARELDNTWGEMGYGGPQPPAGTGDHQYEITVYALDVASVDLAGGASFTGFLEAIRDHILGSATLSGTFGG